MRKRLVTMFLGIVMIFGFSLSAYAAEAEPIVLGFPSALDIVDVIHAKHAADMAVAEINAAGGVNVGGKMRPFTLVYADTRDAQPGIPVREALMAYEKLILQNKPHAIITGFYASEALLASMDITSEHKLPYLGTIAMSPKFQQKIIENYDAYKYLFRLCYDAIYFVKGYLGVLKMINDDFGFNRAFILHEEALWARAIGGMTAKWFKEQGWTVTGQQSFPKGTSDFSASLLNMKNTDTKVIVFICSRPEAVIFADQWRTMKVPALLTGILPALCGETAWKVHEGKIKGIINVVEAGIFPLKGIPESERFYEAYKKRVGEPPGGSHGPGAAYDAVYILKEAIERAGTLDPDKLVTEIEKTDRMGSMGRVRFGKGHQVVFGTNPQEEALVVDFQWQEPGERVAVYPKSVATGKIELPDWMPKK
ncbi:MAG: ABC transporter substrate-binding protein [Pseudomonadota bacterium]